MHVRYLRDPGALSVICIFFFLIQEKKITKVVTISLKIDYIVVE